MTESAARSLGRMFHDISAAIDRQKDRLTSLDGAIGDADHGITMSLGFHAVTMELARLDLDTAAASTVFATAASAFLDAVGASTGPLYASAFLKAAKMLETDASLSLANQVAIIEALTLGIQQRGKGQRGDKTMLDAWIPAMEAAIAAKAEGTTPSDMWRRVTEAAEAGANATSSMVAARGRAARLGQRSLGHIDPGAASAAIILRAMMDSLSTHAASRADLCNDTAGISARVDE
ncbi:MULTISPECIES: dihydroxyacetone kinase subunit DhaL [Rhizobium]|uniref:Dihydroxyacetone kinase subunit DhaL n=1 Tax=Rhizobium rhododendri TaxID=2506430 RepID=A0ABY8IG84_9HYPH|nr:MULTISPECIES: dihydroxyacetone kinase subunit DhaL [Rhizobium]MBZ5763602.1 dihydroxyacetone kinase subunit L [Rhizobium sp. VS19-DR96]MBZ5769533.1 dihydroxyacetone kinase subunit L [Rhizobium sp. VS19-DR129.2]MBZ5777095.1 dihydroxyacetone kinase subunit L [Rhizobium sp. VS19-DRK62.2]MBZ5788227.1 dihydroxyacetone kinase subunit L [Rhizobium sp. VS19-DR121]MBZ5805657.1 dihydroxyacetone kinase subunit L [Rhizobium sp. VS19-DR181]